MYLIDSHCHLNILDYKNLKNGIKDILNEAYNSNVKLFLTVAITISDYEESFKNFKKYPNILYSCGIHPLCKNKKEIKKISKLKEIILKNKNIIALGETGLDYHHKPYNINIQKKLFKKHIKISIETKKPIIIHTRNSTVDIIKILSNPEFKKCKGIIHSFTENISTARKLLDLGFYISFSGIVTFKNASYMNKIIEFIPIEKILIETDSPYLSPHPYRGKKNKPSNLLIIAKYISKIKKINILDLSKQTTDNFKTLFNIKNMK